jgi:tetratricopeptide (TPR) repeat protein
MFESHLHDLRRSNPEVCGLLNILVFWDPDRIEFGTIKVGALFLGTSSEPTKGPSKTDSNWRWTQWFVPSLVRAPYLGFAFSNKSPATGTSNLEPEKDALPSSELESLIKMMSSEVQLQSALQQLQMLSLIKRRSALEGGAYSIHDLTQTLVQVALESEGTHLQWFRCAVRMACGAFRQIQNPTLPENWHQCDGLISHILSLTKYSKSADHKNADLLRARGNIAVYWCDRGRYHEARETYQQLLGVSSDVLHDADIETTQWKLGLAEVNWHLGKHSESALLYEEVRQLQESQLGADHADVLHTVGKLALVYRSQARYAEARSMLEHVLESCKTRLGPDHLDTVQAIDTLAMTINEYAEAENDEAQYAEAESLHKQVLTYREAQLGVDHLDTLWTADNLGTNYRAQGRHVEAVEIYERVLEGRTSQLGEDHPQVLWTVANLASAYTSQGRLDEAEVMYKRAIAGNEQRLGHDHSETLWAVEGLADGYHQQSRLEQATKLYDRALRGMQGRLGAEHPSVMRLMHKLANLHRDRNDFTKSITLFEELLELRKSGQRSANPEMLRTYIDAAASYVCVGKYVEAEQCYRLGLAEGIEEYGSLHAETKKTEQNVAS